MTLLNSIDNYLNNEIRRAVYGENYQSHLAFLGVHAATLTISEVFWNKKGIDGYKLFVTTFMDDDECKFSEIAEVIHNWRNNLAHQWLGQIGHKIAYDYDLEMGYKWNDDILAINPRIYIEKYSACFSGEGKIWTYEQIFSKKEQEEIKQRIIAKFNKRS